MSVRRRVKWEENVRRGGTNFTTEKVTVKSNLRDLGTDVSLILKWVLGKRVVKYVIWIKSTEYEMCFISLCSTGSELFRSDKYLNELSLHALYTSDGGRNA